MLGLVQGNELGSVLSPMNFLRVSFFFLSVVVLVRVLDSLRLRIRLFCTRLLRIITLAGMGIGVVVGLLGFGGGRLSTLLECLLLLELALIQAILAKLVLRVRFLILLHHCTVVGEVDRRIVSLFFVVVAATGFLTLRVMLRRRVGLGDLLGLCDGSGRLQIGGVV